MNTINTINIIARIENIAQNQSYKQQKKKYKERADPFLLPDGVFKMRYRFNKSTVKKIIKMVEPEIKLNKKDCGTSSDLQVLVALRCWGRREIQDDAVDLHGLTQPTVCRICSRVARALARLGKRKIKMPQSLTEEENLMRDFKAIRNFPGVIGAIDGTHIKIKKTGDNLAQYYIMA